MVMDPLDRKKTRVRGTGPPQPARPFERSVKRILIAAILAASVLSFVNGADARSVSVAPHCRAIVGTWMWPTGVIMTIRPDGTVHQPGNEGMWQCTNPAARMFTIRWNLDGSFDTVTLSNDDSLLSATNQDNDRITATRRGLPPFPF